MWNLLLLPLLALSYPLDDLVVSLPDLPDLPSPTYSGYLPLPSTHKSLHYLATLSLSRPETDPVILWYSGGPGCSSMLAFMDEIGPFYMREDGGWNRNDWAWNSEATLVFIDAPAGVPFSICGQ